MILSLVVAAGVAEKCAPRVARETILSVAYHESRFDTLAIGDNTARKSIHPKSRMDAVAIAQDLIARGHSIDMGIGQVNNRTAARLGLTIFAAFDACANMAAAGKLMEANYQSVAKKGGNTQQAVAAMLSMYNTGNTWRGFGNGYVGSVYRVAANIVSQLGKTTRVDVDPRALDPVEAVTPIPVATVQPSALAGDPRSIPMGSPLSPMGSPLPAPVAPAPIPTPAPPPAWIAFGNPSNVMVFGSR